MPLVFSTSWNAFRFDKVEDMLFEIKKLGFSDLELSFNLTAAMVSEIAGLIQKGGFKVHSVHNFCPYPEAFKRQEILPDCYSISSFEEEERRLAVQYTKRTIDTATLLGAEIVVLHCGRVQMQDKTQELISLYERGLKDTEGFRSLKEEFLRERDSIAHPFFDQALRSLEELNSYAETKSIGLGIENRFYYREIPSLQELGIILNEFKSSRIFYWHDTGHAQVMENLGFAKHKDYLKLYGHRMIGAHLHNVVGCLDHQAPVNGTIDFLELKSYLNKETLKVIEAHHPATGKDIKKSKAFLEEIFNDIL